jgi:hypothetical protein
MTSVANGKIRRWYIQKSDKCNISNERYVYFGEFKPSVHDHGWEWIPVISLDDFHKEVNINISRWVEVCGELQGLKEENEKLRALILYTDPILSSEECGGEIQLKQWSEFCRCFPEYGKLNKPLTENEE